MKKIFLLLVCLNHIPLLAADTVSYKDLAGFYPHWQIDSVTTKQLIQIEDFIQRYKNQGKAAIFDWDGTLYSEQIVLDGKTRATLNTCIKNPEVPKSAQAVWRLWSAAQIAANRNENLFPAFASAEGVNREADKIRQACDIVRFTDYLEGGYPSRPDKVSKFLALATMEAGMKIKDFYDYFGKFLNDSKGYYEPCSLTITPMLDIMQRLTDNGFKVWVVTGSNPHLITALMKRIEDTCVYSQKKKYSLALTKSAVYNPATDHIIGNGPRQNGEVFSQAFDDRFFRQSGKETAENVFVSAEEGKTAAIRQWIEGENKQEAVFAAGNSDGDADMMAYILGKGESGKNVLGISVNARQPKLLEIIAKHSQGKAHSAAQALSLNPGEHVFSK